MGQRGDEPIERPVKKGQTCDQRQKMKAFGVEKRALGKLGGQRMGQHRDDPRSREKAGGKHQFQQQSFTLSCIAQGVFSLVTLNSNERLTGCQESDFLEALRETKPN